MLILTKSDLFTYAWVLARAAGKRDGQPARRHLSAALKCAWAARKADVARAAKAQAAVRAVEAEVERAYEPARKVAGYTRSMGFRTGRYQGGRW